MPSSFLSQERMLKAVALIRNILLPAAALAVLAVAPLAQAAGQAGSVVLAVGEASIGGAPTKGGTAVQEGDRIVTGANGYVYVKTVDNGFLILRPKSAARIIAYHVDAQNPANSHFKFALDQGVARSISGTAVKQARQNFRFNTPVAAIGVRGTDFTVSTDQQVTRIQVVSGGIVAGGFGAGCSPDGSGPCEGASVRELFATLGSQMLLISRGQPVPQLLRGGALAPDTVAPPRVDEPAAKAGGNADAANGHDPNLTPLKLAGVEISTPAPVAADPPPAVDPGPPAIVWGRWQAVAGQAAEIDPKNLPAGYGIAAINSFYALLRDRNAVWQPPAGGVVSFAMLGAQAGIRFDGAASLVPASVENGKLTIDFNSSSFTTQFDLVTQSDRLQRFAQGAVGSDGGFGNPSVIGTTNMVVQGVLANNAATGGLNAAYLFQSRLDDLRSAYGVTYWGK